MHATIRSRLTLLAMAMAAGVAGAAISQAVSSRVARAQPQSSISTIYVPSDGLLFRSLDGRPIARLTRDVNGGLLELYDERDEPATRLSSADHHGGLRVNGPPSIPARLFTLDEEDPWVPRPQPAPVQPPPF